MEQQEHSPESALLLPRSQEIGKIAIDETKLVNQIDHGLNTPSGMSPIGTPDERSEDETDVFKETTYRVQVALEGFC